MAQPASGDPGISSCGLVLDELCPNEESCPAPLTAVLPAGPPDALDPPTAVTAPSCPCCSVIRFAEVIDSLCSAASVDPGLSEDDVVSETIL